MPIYELRCEQGHRFEVIQSYDEELPACSCGAATARVPSRVGLAGASMRVPRPAERMPQTWRGTYNGNREYVARLRREAEQRATLEERHPELAGDKRPVVAHEGRFEGAPLRHGDPLPPAPG